MADFLWNFWAFLGGYGLNIDPFWGMEDFVGICGTNDELDRDWCT